MNLSPEDIPKPDASIADAQAERDGSRAALDRLNEQARVIREGIIMPKDGRCSAEEIDRVVAIFRSYIQDHLITMRQAAREIGYSSPVLSEFASGNYKGDRAKVARAVNNWLARDSRRRAARRNTDYIKTWVAEDMRAVIMNADQLTKMAALVVPSGAGKTKVLQLLAKELNGIMVYATTGMTARELYLAIARELGWHKEKARRGELLQFIIETLTGTRHVIMVDEAHQLGKHVGDLRVIHDRAKVPIIMAGAAEILDLVNDRGHGAGQFASRTIPYNCLEFVFNAESPAGAEKGRDLFTIEEIKAFFDAKQIRFDREGMRLAWALACLPNYGTLRLLENIIDTIINGDPDIETATRDDVLDALRLLVGGHAPYLSRLAGQHLETKRPAAVAKAG